MFVRAGTDAWAEACEKERRTWLRPAATAQDTTAADTARTLAHTAKLGWRSECFVRGRN